MVLKPPVRIGVGVIALLALVGQTVKGEPPFPGTIFIDPDIITSSDPTSFQSASYAGRGLRTMFDRRVNNWINVNAYLVAVGFGDGSTTEIQVNPEFGSPAAALTEAQKLARSSVACQPRFEPTFKQFGFTKARNRSEAEITTS